MPSLRNAVRGFKMIYWFVFFCFTAGYNWDYRQQTEKDSSLIHSNIMRFSLQQSTNQLPNHLSTLQLVGRASHKIMKTHRIFKQIVETDDLSMRKTWMNTSTDMVESFVNCKKKNTTNTSISHIKHESFFIDANYFFSFITIVIGLIRWYMRTENWCQQSGWMDETWSERSKKNCFFLIEIPSVAIIWVEFAIWFVPSGPQIPCIIGFSLPSNIWCCCFILFSTWFSPVTKTCLWMITSASKVKCCLFQMFFCFSISILHISLFGLALKRNAQNAKENAMQLKMLNSKKKNKLNVRSLTVVRWWFHFPFISCRAIGCIRGLQL